MVARAALWDRWADAPAECAVHAFIRAPANNQTAVRAHRYPAHPAGIVTTGCPLAGPVSVNEKMIIRNEKVDFDR
jgi:hypothetical protein